MLFRSAIEGSFPMAFHKDHWCGTWSQFMDLGVGVVLVDIEQDVLRGAIGGYVSPDVCDGAMTLHEGFWYVYPEHRGSGVKLLKAFTEEGKKRGAERMTMIHLNFNGPSLAKLYEREGFKPVQTTYMKEI